MGYFLYFDAWIRRWVSGAEATAFWLYAFSSFMLCYVGSLDEGLERRGRGVPGFRIRLAVRVSYLENARSGPTCDLSLSRKNGQDMEF